MAAEEREAGALEEPGPAAEEVRGAEPGSLTTVGTSCQFLYPFIDLGTIYSKEILDFFLFKIKKEKKNLFTKHLLSKSPGVPLCSPGHL